MIGRNLAQSVKELIFSKRCPICKKIVQGNGYICDSCYVELKRKGRLKNNGNYYYLYYYDEDIKSLIADFKLKNRKNLGREIAYLIKKDLIRLINEKEIEIVLPVPISREREKERGFNQVEVLLDECGVKYEKIVRQKNTKHMYELFDGKSRKENIYKAFRNNSLDLNDKNILIVDDIVTTGSTIREMVKEIERESKPKAIYIFSLAISKRFKN